MTLVIESIVQAVSFVEMKMNWLAVNSITDWLLKQSVVGTFQSVNGQSYLYRSSEEAKNITSDP